MAAEVCRGADVNENGNAYVEGNGNGNDYADEEEEGNEDGNGNGCGNGDGHKRGDVTLHEGKRTDGTGHRV